jgi:glutathione S-transferase
MNTSSAQVPVLITFPPSLDSELGRFLVEHYGVQHREQPHALIFSFFATLWHGWTVIFPLLYSDSFKLVGPRAMSEYLDSRCAADLRLWPQEESQRQQVEKDWTLFNETLAFATARFAYYHLLPHRDLMIRPLSLGAPDFERRTVEFAYPVFAGLLRTLLGLTARRAQESLDQARTIFDAVDIRLAAGASYLVGDHLTLSDLAFAVAAAPLVLPRAYGGPIPSFDEMPAAVQSAVNEMRGRPAGAYALRIYEEQRNRVGSQAA